MSAGLWRGKVGRAGQGEAAPMRHVCPLILSFPWVNLIEATLRYLHSLSRDLVLFRRRRRRVVLRRLRGRLTVTVAPVSRKQQTQTQTDESASLRAGAVVPLAVAEGVEGAMECIPL